MEDILGNRDSRPDQDNMANVYLRKKKKERKKKKKTTIEKGLCERMEERKNE